MILKVQAFGPFDTNVYIFACSNTRQAVVIDAPIGCSDWVLHVVETNSLSVQKVIFTHSHWDHIADAAALQEALSVPFCVHEADAPNLRHPGTDGLPIYMSIPGVESLVLIKEGEEILVGEMKLVVIHTPGHTPGGICLYEEKQGILFSGDTVFQGTMGRIDFPTSEPEKMWSSLKKLSLLPPSTKVYPGHGDATTIGHEKWLAHAQETFS